MWVDAPQVGNFNDQKWGISVIAVSDARNRYKIRYTTTQHRPPSRQVNDHGRVSGTHVCPEGK